MYFILLSMLHAVQQQALASTVDAIQGGMSIKLGVSRKLERPVLWRANTVLPKKSGKALKRRIDGWFCRSLGIEFKSVWRKLPGEKQFIYERICFGEIVENWTDEAEQRWETEKHIQRGGKKADADLELRGRVEGGRERMRGRCQASEPSQHVR